MQQSSRTTLLVATALLLAAGGCTDARRAPLAPAADGGATAQTAARPAGTPGSTRKVKMSGVRWRTRLEADTSASAVIGSEGGVVALPATGLRLVVPAGAVTRPTPFRVTAVAGKLVAYDFEPAGSVFPIPLRIEQSRWAIDLESQDPVGVQAGYFPSREDLDQTQGAGNVAELLEVRWFPDFITFHVSHFSGYMVGWGFKER